MSEKERMPAKPPQQEDDDTLTAVTHGEVASEAGAESGEANLAVLGPQLRGLYKELLLEPIPDRFIQLLDELERKEADKT